MAETESVNIHSEPVDLDLDNLDERQFEIAPADDQQTLDNILKERGDEGSIAEAEFPASDLIGGSDPGETGSVCSQEGLLADRPRKKVKKHVRYAEHGPVLRHVILKGISAQILSAADRVDSGRPSALAVSSLIAVGTTHGLVLIFDPKQVLKLCLGSTAVGAQYGAVSAVSFNRDCTRLLSGFAKGQITMWDLTNGKLLRTITDAHPPGSAILHVKFTDDLTVAVASDSGGSVYELEFKRTMGMRSCESKCLFSGSRGEVCTIEPLHVNQTIQDHPLKDILILAMGSLSKVLIVTLRPKLKVLCIQDLKGDASTLPLLAWHFVIIQVSDQDRVIDPVLAYARDHTINFLQVVCNSAEDINVVSLQKTTLPYKLLAISWMNSRTMVVLDTTERAHVLDVRSEEELEVVDLADIHLVYSADFYKAVATGGNVSEALAYAGDRACYHSVVAYSGQLVLLGNRGIHVMTMRPWNERLDTLLKQMKYPEALSLADAFYRGKGKAVVGLYGSTKQRKATVAERMLEILYEYVDLAMTSLCPDQGRVEELENHFQTVVPVCVDYCLALNRMDVLFGHIFERFSEDAIAKGTFLECLEPYILNDKLTFITPIVMKDFVAHYERREMVQNVEACIIHMDIASLDIHQVVSLCWQHNLYDAILYIYNKGMLDYITPLEELMSLLIAAVSNHRGNSQLNPQQIKLGNKLLVYISCCLAGRAYPLGDIPQDHVSRVKDEVFRKLICLHTRDHNEEETNYPYLKALLHFDTREFFNVLALAFEEPDFDAQQGIDKRQQVVDILLQIMVESTGFSPTQIGILFTFLARQMARHESTIVVNRVLFEQVLESLCAHEPSDTYDSRHEERQQALLELLGAGGLEHFNEARLLRLAENAQFFRVCETLYQKRRQYDKILSCYWRDSARQHQSFSYIEHIMMSEQYSREDKDKVKVEAMAHLRELVAIDSKKTAQLVLVGFANSLAEVVKILRKDEELLLELLSGVFEQREGSNTSHMELQFNVDPDIHELYIELLCKYKPSLVHSYITAADGYRLDETLKICRKYEMSDATAYLLEKAGDVQGAFQLLLESLQTKLQDLLAGVRENTKDGEVQHQDLSSQVEAAQSRLLIVVQLCKRSSSGLSDSHKEKLWFGLLDAVMIPQRTLKDLSDPTSADEFKELTRHVLNNMLGYIPLQTVLQRVLQDPIYSSGKFGEVKDLLLGMLDTCSYEKTLLHTCNSLVNHDLYRQLAILSRAASRGVVPKLEVCNICSKDFLQMDDSDSIICFRCGHGYHLLCLHAVGSMVTVDGDTTWTCYLCNKTKRRGNISSTRTQRQLSTSGVAGVKPKPSTSKEPTIDNLLDSEQMQAIDNLRRVQKTPSRLAILSELSRLERAGGVQKYRPPPNSIFQNEKFQLRLAHPPPDFNS